MSRKTTVYLSDETDRILGMMEESQVPATRKGIRGLCFNQLICDSLQIGLDYMLGNLVFKSKEEELKRSLNNRLIGVKVGGLNAIYNAIQNGTNRQDPTMGDLG